MITLPYQYSPQDIFLQIVESETNEWDLFIGRWKQYAKDQAEYDVHLKATAPIVMNSNDLAIFAKELQAGLREKPPQRKYLSLRFRENKPHFVVGITYMRDQSQPLYREKIKGMFELIVGINVHYSAQTYPWKEDDYLYQDGGMHVGMIQYYDVQQLEEFAEKLGQKAGPSSKKRPWQFW